ncbi:MAG: galactokinase [Planctomycetes bacterium]|nr:galactokinase [Planctomycetota bacterium]
MPARVQDRFAQEFGATPRPVLWFAPGRINLIGAHLDYSGGDVMPLAVDLGVYAAGRLRDDGVIRLRSLDQQLAVDTRVDAIRDRRDPAHDWAGYPLGVWQEFREWTGLAPGVDMVFGGDLPMASGLSSSAAIEVATAFLLDDLLGTEIDARELALLCHRAETRYVGLQCGIMDQFASALCRPRHALLLHCHDGTYEHVAMHGRGFEILVMDTRRPRTLATSGFNDRVRECAEAHRILRRDVRDLPYLAAYSQADVEAARGALGATLYKRARHVVGEMVRVRSGVAGLRTGRVEQFGAALTGSHRSTSVDYEVSCPELDLVTSVACESEHVFGARLTGAGFGGCAIALIEPGTAQQVERRVDREFSARFGTRPAFMVLHAGGGPRRVD